MHLRTLQAFGEELEKLASGRFATGLSPKDMARMLEKDAAFLQNVGNRIVSFSRGVGENIGQGVYNTVVSPGAGLKEGWKHTLHHPTEGMLSSFRKGGSHLGKVMAVGMVAGTAMGANDLRKKNDPSGQGRGRMERVGEFAGQTLGGITGAPHHIMGGLAGMYAGGKILGGVGKAADKAYALVRRKPAPGKIEADPGPIQAQSQREA